VRFREYGQTWVPAWLFFPWSSPLKDSELHLSVVPDRRGPISSSSCGAPEKNRLKKSSRPAVPAVELEAKLMELIRERPSCARVRSFSIVYVETLGSEPN
jgi:hypothetical protein